VSGTFLGANFSSREGSRWVGWAIHTDLQFLKRSFHLLLRPCPFVSFRNGVLVSGGRTAWGHGRNWQSLEVDLKRSLFPFRGGPTSQRGLISSQHVSSARRARHRPYWSREAPPPQSGSDVQSASVEPHEKKTYGPRGGYYPTLFQSYSLGGLMARSLLFLFPCQGLERVIPLLSVRLI